MFVVLTHKQQADSYDNTRLHTTLHTHPNDTLTLVGRYQVHLAASYSRHATRTPDARHFRPTISSSVTASTCNVPGVVAITTLRLLSYIGDVPAVYICLSQ